MEEQYHYSDKPNQNKSGIRFSKMISTFSPKHEQISFFKMSNEVSPSRQKFSFKGGC